MSDANKWANVLPFEEWQILHGAIMRYPDGSPLSALDQRVQVLLEAGYLQQKGHLYYPTEKGIHHVMPSRLKQQQQQKLLQVRH